MTEQQHETIWLQPWCAACEKHSNYGEGRLWCQDDPWGPCDECGAMPVKYTLAPDQTTAQVRVGLFMHTPGPWRRGLGNDAHRVFDTQGRIVADHAGYDDGDLIAAAPSLLAGCRAALEMVDGNGAPPDWDWLRRIVKQATRA